MERGDFLIYRKPPDATHIEIQRVQYLDRVSKLKHNVRFDDGREESVMGRTLLAPWRYAERVREDDRGFEVLKAATSPNEVLARATETVLDTTGDEFWGTYADPPNRIEAAETAWSRLLERLGDARHPLELNELAYRAFDLNEPDVDLIAVPLDAAAQLARRLVATDPTSVRLGIEAEDKERHPVLRDTPETKRAKAMVDAWLGDAPPSEINALRVEVAELRAEVARLRARLDELSTVMPASDAH